MSDSEFETVFKKQELYEMFSAGEVKPLDDIYSIEDIALSIKDLDKKLDFYKNYKKKKAQDINDEIKVIENKVDFFKSVIVTTLKHNNEKSVKFPGSCSVSSRNQKATWSINDEEEFIGVLQAAQKDGENVDDVLDKVTQYNVRKREATKLLDIWEKNGKLEKFLKKAKKDAGDIVEKGSSKTTVSIKFLEEDKEETSQIDDFAIPKKEDKSNLKDFDVV